MWCRDPDSGEPPRTPLLHEQELLYPLKQENATHQQPYDQSGCRRIAGQQSFSQRHKLAPSETTLSVHEWNPCRRGQQELMMLWATSLRNITTHLVRQGRQGKLILVLCGDGADFRLSLLQLGLTQFHDGSQAQVIASLRQVQR